MSLHPAKNREQALALVCAVSVSLALVVKPTAAQKRRTVRVPKEIVQQLIKDEEIRELIRLRPDGSAENLVAESIDLNRDGEPELEVHGIGVGICGAANCPTWIHSKVGTGYQLLLDAGSIQRVEPQRTFTNGYRDIMTSIHGSAWDSDLTLYKFDGKQYQRVRCFYRSYRYKDRRSRMREWRGARITPVKCEPKQ